MAKIKQHDSDRLESNDYDPKMALSVADSFYNAAERCNQQEYIGNHFVWLPIPAIVNYHQAAEQTEEALGPLAGVVGLKAHAHLDNAPAQDDDAQGLDDGEDEVAQVVDDSQRVGTPSSEGRDGQCGAEG